MTEPTAQLTASENRVKHSLIYHPFTPLFFKFFFFFPPNLFLTALGLHCCSLAFSSDGKQGLLSSCGAQASHCCGFSLLWLLLLWGLGSRVESNRLSCSVACETFLDQGLNPCTLHWQANFFYLSHLFFIPFSLFSGFFWIS